MKSVAGPHRFGDTCRDGRRSLDAAKGVLVVLRQCSLDEAFTEIVDTARQHGTEPMALARVLVATAENGSTRELDDRAVVAVDLVWGPLLRQVRQSN
ncbi:ANTAR domain-containing protein [Mycobacterium sp. CVI_P3]|uniref:ANTAR domain-containing protein n=1 Tax=Mycobacterium pinniadriaticum TaxID=2994102 RepID=A0ABT3SAG6_9MYCO|nr:ANTAR domain-containing protein [Mycobacterium pinniadriaticum]MCX2929866.1 ANTAR domain-containing protein [Mycobacterium pinniadriaticum]MCX2936485.1 ANTAR domain-containing protein [Mycobacterium pinniadriaticum]